MAAATTKQKQLTPVQRAAAVVIALGADRASEVYRYLKDDEVEQISLEDRQAQPGSRRRICRVPSRISMDSASPRRSSPKGGVLYAKDVLEKAFARNRPPRIWTACPKSLRTRSFESIRKADYKNLWMILQNEHPQTIALVLSYARSDQAAQIIAELPRAVQLDVVERIAGLDRVSPEMIKLVEDSLEARFTNITSADQVEVGGVPYVAEIMNRVDRSTEKYIFDELGGRNAALADEIHKLMFTFEDIVNLDSMAIQRFIREVDTKDLAVALKSANEEVKRVIFQNMSSRMRENIEQDIQFLHNIRMRDVEEAQQKIVGVIRQLEEAGEIVIAKGEETRSLPKVIRTRNLISAGEVEIPDQVLPVPMEIPADPEEGAEAPEAQAVPQPDPEQTRAVQRKNCPQPAGQMQTQAEETSGKILRHAGEERERILQEARTEAEEIRRQAREEAYQAAVEEKRQPD